MPGPLVDLRVLELTRNVAGPFAGKLLADFGAGVLKLEPPEGDPSRRFGPFPADQPHPERSGLFLHLNTNKRSAVVDPATAEGAATIRRLAAEADVLLEDYAPGQAAAWGWDPRELAAANPGLAVIAITPFGQTGPYRDYRGSELTLEAIGGPLHQTGNREREPLKLAGHYAQYHAGLTAALAALLIRRRVEDGDPNGGDYVDLSIHECQSGCRDRRTIHLTAAAYSGVSPKRASVATRRMGAGIRVCEDGFVNITGAGTRLPKLLKLIGREDLLDHPDLYAPPALVPTELFEEIEGALHAYLEHKPKLEAVREAQSLGLLAGAVMTVADLFGDEHYGRRGFWETIDHPETGPLTYTGRPFVMSASPRPPAGRAPLLGEHQAAIEAPWPDRADGPPEAPPASAAPPPAPAGGKRLPLEGIKVADITVVWAGPHVTQLLAEWGAEVIRVEPVNKIQPNTRGAESIFSKAQWEALAESGLQPWYPDMDPGPDPWNRAASFNSHGRNKLSITADVMSPEGREAFLRLIAQSDVFVENNVPETIDKANIGWEVLRQVNPRLIMLRMPAFSLDGEYRNYRAFGLHVEAMVGHTHLRGYGDIGPEYIGETLSSDGISGVQGALAIAMALRHRDRTGAGQLIEMPLTEGFLPTFGEFVMDYTMNGRDTPPQANRHRWNAPHNVYPTRGDDQWIAIDVATDEEFAALCQLLGAGDLASDPRYAEAATRLDHRDALDDALFPLIAPWDKDELFHALQGVGVNAAPLHTPLDALADPHLEERGFFEEITRPDLGTHRYPGITIRMAGTTNHVRTPPPKLGEHNEEIYLGRLGYTREELEAMVAKGLVGTRYPDSLIHWPKS
jgi:crotonobetainyl-CoA:carnitine CoA-transferase CaiB-like acyl-CoA transferase